jgi:hypothetical protein
MGLAGGDIVLKTDGTTGYTVTANGNLIKRKDDKKKWGNEVTELNTWTYDFDWPQSKGR